MFAFTSFSRRVLARALVLLSALVLAGCDPLAMPGGSAGGGSGKSVDPNAPVQVAMLLPRSDAGAGVVARSLENAARMAASQLKDVRVELRVYDTAGSPSQAASQAQKAINDGAKIIVGPLFAEAANAVGVVAAAQNVNVLSFSNNPSIAGGNVFILGSTFDNTANRLLNFASRSGKRRVLIAHPQNLEGQFGRDAIQRAAVRNGVNVAGIESFAFSQAGVADAIPRITSAARSGGADMLFLTSNAAGALPLLVQMLPEAGLTNAQTQYIGLSRWDTPSQTLGLRGLQGGWFAMPDPQREMAFAARYRAMYGSNPHALGSLAFDAIAAIGTSVKQSGSKGLTAGALTKPSGFQGATGIFRLTRSGTNQRGLAVAQVRGGKPVILENAPQSFGGAGF